MCNKREELQILLNEQRPDIVAITEILPKNRSQLFFSDAEWHIPGYNSFLPNLNDHQGRGCMIYTKDSIEAYHVQLEEHRLIEHLTIGICCTTGKSCYSPVYTEVQTRVTTIV